jgi:hypothetical protein
MTTKEKRMAIRNECDRWGDCDECPHHKFGFCDNYNSTDASSIVIDRWYQAFFGDDPTPHIKDSGERREFATGAVRDIQEGKGRCDLMPLDVIHRIYHEKSPYTGRGIPLGYIQTFIDTGDIDYLMGAIEHFMLDGKPFGDCNWSTMFLEVAKHFEDGAKKYGEHNWQKGIPTHCYIDSAVRHYLKWLRGDTDEPHDHAFVWNILCCIWTCIHKPELNDYMQKCEKEDTKTMEKCDCWDGDQNV